MDTMVDSVFPTTQSWSAWDELDLEYNGATALYHWGWYKFNLTEAWRGAINITSVKLGFFDNYIAMGSGSSYWVVRSIDPLNETWADTTITWNNQPSTYGWYEAPPTSIPYSNQQWLIFDLYAGNSTQGIGAIQDAYNNNRTESFRLGCTSTPYTVWFYTREATNNKPYLQVFYTQTETSEEMGRPTIENPSYKTLRFYAIADTAVTSASPDTNYDGENISQVNYRASMGFTTDIMVKFNISYPDYIDGVKSDKTFSLHDYYFTASSIVFESFCHYVPFDQALQGFDCISSIARADEGWNASTVTWNTRPLYHSRWMSSTLITNAQYWTFDIGEDEGIIRANIYNHTTYSIVNHINHNKSAEGVNSWRMLEYEYLMQDGYSRLWPHIDMEVAISTYTVPSIPHLTWTNAHIYLANQWHLTPFIAGMLLCAMIYGAFMVPIGWMLRRANKGVFFMLVLTMVFDTIFLMFGWFGDNGIMLYGFIMLVMVVTMGGKLKGWIS